MLVSWPFWLLEDGGSMPLSPCPENFGLDPRRCSLHQATYRSVPSARGTLFLGPATGQVHPRTRRGLVARRCLGTVLPNSPVSLLFRVEYYGLTIGKLWASSLHRPSAVTLEDPPRFSQTKQATETRHKPTCLSHMLCPRAFSKRPPSVQPYDSR